MKTGVIMEINERFLTLLTPEGEFLRAAKLNEEYEIGQEINFFPINLVKAKNRAPFSQAFTLRAKIVFSIAAILLVVFASIFTIDGDTEVYAYMSIDMNPSMELAINEKFQVIDVLPLNKEGENIVNQIHIWNKKDVKAVTNQIIEEMKSQGYAKDKIVIGTVHAREQNKKLDSKWKEEIKVLKESIRKEKLDVMVMDATLHERNQAKEKGLSVGSYIKTQVDKKNKDHSEFIKPHNKEKKQSNEHPNSSERHYNGKQKSDQSIIAPGQIKKNQDFNNHMRPDKPNNVKPPALERKQYSDNANHHKKNNENKDKQKNHDSK